MWTVETMTAADVPSLAALERACFAHPWSADAIAAELKNPAAVFLVAKTEGGACGGYVAAVPAAGLRRRTVDAAAAGRMAKGACPRDA